MADRNERKPRDEYVYARTVEGIDRIELAIDSSGNIDFITPIERIYSQVEYSREKGPKIINRIPQSSMRGTFDQGAAIDRNYDQIMAVDTNTKMIRDHFVSVTGISICNRVWISGHAGLQHCMQYYTPFCIEMHDVKVNPERLGWIVALEQLYIHRMISPDSRIGIVIDSFQDEIFQINSRERPILDDEYLWTNTTLIYASSDVGAEHLVNKLIRCADKAASRCMKIIEDQTIPDIERVDSNQNYSAIRLLFDKARNQDN